MTMLDLTPRTEKTWRNHFKIRVNDVDISYSYIRKNACTAFKKFFIAMSSEQIQKNEIPLKFMDRVHKVNMESVVSSDFRVCVLRDPVDRIVSLFQNKFVVRSYNDDIFSSYRLRTGKSPETASFADFVKDYLVLEESEIDPHCYSQYSHLMPVQYNVACLLSDLHDEMSNVVGSKIAKKYFFKRVNSTPASGYTDVDLSNVPAEVLKSLGLTPQKSNLCTVELEGLIRDKYTDDCKLLQSTFAF